MQTYEAFADMEAAGWADEAIVNGYIDSFGPVTDRAADQILAWLAPTPGMRVLDLCCGEGRFLARLADAGAAPIGVDFSPSMCRRAARRAPAVRVLQAPADAIPVETGSVDAVVCAFGFGHIPDTDAALSEVRRVLVPGGHLFLAAWVEPARSAAFTVFFGALRAWGDLSLKLPSPDLFEFGDRERAQSRLTQAGFELDRAHTLEATWRFSDPDGLFHLFETATVSGQSLLRRQTAAAQQAIKSEMRKRVADSFAVGSEFEVPVGIYVTSAIRA